MLVFPQPLRQPTAHTITEGRLGVDQEVNDHSQGGSGIPGSSMRGLGDLNFQAISGP
jgi:hypothetical protein